MAPLYEFTIEECRQWLANDTRNPRTNRVISATGEIYRLLVQQCRQFGLGVQQVQILPPNNPNPQINQQLDVVYLDSNNWIKTKIKIENCRPPNVVGRTRGDRKDHCYAPVQPQPVQPQPVQPVPAQPVPAQPVPAQAQNEPSFEEMVNMAFEMGLTEDDLFLMSMETLRDFLGLNNNIANLNIAQPEVPQIPQLLEPQEPVPQLPEPQEDDEEIEKQRQEIIKNVLADSLTTTENIVYDEFEEMSLDDLKTLVKIGPVTKDNKFCYYCAEGLSNYIKERKEKGAKITDLIISTYELKNSELKEVERIMKLKDKNFSLEPKKFIVPKHISLQFSQSGSYMVISYKNNRTNITKELVRLYDGLEDRRFNSVDITSASLSIKIQDMFNNGKLFVNYEDPSTFILKKEFLDWKRIRTEKDVILYNSELLQHIKNVLIEN